MSSDPLGLVGTTIAGRYVVDALAAQGRSSLIYRARCSFWNRPVAIKAFRGFESSDAVFRDSFWRGFVQRGAVLAELSDRSSAVVQARDTAALFTSKGEWVPYLVLEWLDGESLEAVLGHERRVELVPRTIAHAVALLDRIACALTLAHSKGLEHGDLRPGGFFILGDPRSDDASVKLLDFGVGSFCIHTRRAISEGRPLSSTGFTPAYAAPEQFSEAYGITGPWTDVFALALVLMELVSGRAPSSQGPAPGVLDVELPDAVQDVLARALALYPAERWQTAGTFWHALRTALKSTVAAQPPPRELGAASGAALELGVSSAPPSR